MDLQLAAYKANKFGYSNAKPSEYPFGKKRVEVAMADTHKYNQMLKQIRHSSARRQEGHDKQVALLVNRRKYAQNQTWLHEYDRLASQPGAPDGRLDQLKSLILGNQPFVVRT